MNLLRIAVLGGFVTALAGVAAAHAADPAAKTKIVGVWEATKGDLPPGSTIEFTKEGKVKVAFKGPDGKLIDVPIEATYAVDGDKVKVTSKGPDGKDKTEAMTIKTLNDKELVLSDEMKKEVSFTKKK